MEAWAKYKNYHYLVSSLPGEAKQMTANMTVRENNFNHAWDLIVAGYNNPKIICAKHCRAPLLSRRGIFRARHKRSPKQSNRTGDGE
jgi:hypothetical protein